MKLASPDLTVSLLPIFLIFLLVQGSFLEHASANNKIEAEVAAFRGAVGKDDWRKLQTRLVSLNQDVSQKGILPFPRTSNKLLTGYAYHEFYNGDLYFENLYLSYYGINDYCYTNFKFFLSRQKPS